MCERVDNERKCSKARIEKRRRTVLETHRDLLRASDYCRALAAALDDPYIHMRRLTNQEHMSMIRRQQQSHATVKDTFYSLVAMRRDLAYARNHLSRLNDFAYWPLAVPVYWQMGRRFAVPDDVLELIASYVSEYTSVRPQRITTPLDDGLIVSSRRLPRIPCPSHSLH
ncbi:MAG: hypothetical protein Q7V62_09400 [Actinomycetota bacterium]|nr:hypothetical protein [Actinomycetota bacterium]